MTLILHSEHENTVLHFYHGGTAAMYEKIQQQDHLLFSALSVEDGSITLLPVESASSVSSFCFSDTTL